MTSCVTYSLGMLGSEVKRSVEDDAEHGARSGGGGGGESKLGCRNQHWNHPGQTDWV